MVKYLKWIRVLVNNFRNMICRMEALVFDTACRLKRLTALPWVPCSYFSVTFTFSTRLSPILCVFNDIKANQIKYLTTFCACAHGTKRIKMPIYRTHTHEQWTIYGGNKNWSGKKMGEKTSNCTCMKLVESGTQPFFISSSLPLTRSRSLLASKFSMEIVLYYIDLCMEIESNVIMWKFFVKISIKVHRFTTISPERERESDKTGMQLWSNEK